MTQPAVRFNGRKCIARLGSGMNSTATAMTATINTICYIARLQLGLNYSYKTFKLLPLLMAALPVMCGVAVPCSLPPQLLADFNKTYPFILSSFLLAPEGVVRGLVSVENFTLKTTPCPAASSTLS